MRGLRTILLLVLFMLTGCGDSPSGSPSLIAFTATWCQPCQQDKSMLVEVAGEFPVTEIDVDEHRDIAIEYHVQAVPLYVVLDARGRESGRTSDLASALDTLRLFRQ